MMRLQTFATTAALVALGTITFAQNVTFDFDRAVDFARLRSYSWVRGTVLSDQLNHGRIVRAVDAQLSQKGLAKIEQSASPDVLVAYHATFDRNLEINGFSTGWGPYRLGGNRSGVARAEQILVGTLALDVVHAKTNTIVWRGLASKDIDVKASPEKREKNINQTVGKLFKNFPPKQ
jgi:hypothetical protein